MGTGSAAFLLAQVGAYAARKFDERISELELTPPQVGVLRAIAMQPGRSQQALAEQLGTPATRLVALLDALERRGAIERRRNPDDRRLHALHLTEAGQELMRSVGRVAMAHGADLTSALDDSERAQLQRLLLRIAEDKKLAAGAHPGFRSI